MSKTARDRGNIRQLVCDLTTTTIMMFRGMVERTFLPCSDAPLYKVYVSSLRCITLGLKSARDLCLSTRALSGVKESVCVACANLRTAKGRKGDGPWSEQGWLCTSAAISQTTAHTSNFDTSSFDTSNGTDVLQLFLFHMLFKYGGGPRAQAYVG